MQSRCFQCLRHKCAIPSILCLGRLISTTSEKRTNKSGNRDKDKCALITGGASGIGLECAKALLSHGCKGVTLAGTNQTEGESALRCIYEKFGTNKAIFLKCDCSKPESVDWAFKNTLRVFDRLDIVINNANLMNDKQWEHEISTNINGCLIGSLLGLQYMSCTCQGKGGVVVNMASTMGITPFHGCPIYSMTQSAIIGLTRSLGEGCHVSRTGVKIMGLCVGLTDECMLMEGVKNAINEKFGKEFQNELNGKEMQDPIVVGHALKNVLEDSNSGSIWVVDGGGPACKLKFPGIEELKCCCSVPEKGCQEL